MAVCIGFFLFSVCLFVFVCVCSDNSINQRLISKMLSRLGFNTHQFRLTADGQSAAEEIQRANVMVAAAAPTSLSTSSSVQSLQLLVGQSSSASSSHSGDREHDADSHSPAVSTCDSSSSSADGLSFSPRGQWHGALGVEPGSNNSSSSSLVATATQRAAGSGAIGTLTADVVPSAHGPLASILPLAPAAAVVVSPNCYDLVLMDLQMPICDGFEVCSAAQRDRAGRRRHSALRRAGLCALALLRISCRSSNRLVLSSSVLCFSLVLFHLLSLCSFFFFLLFQSTSLIRGMVDIVQPFICALTANAMEGDDKECIDRGMNHYLSKPLFIATLVNAIQMAHAFKTNRKQTATIESSAQMQVQAHHAPLAGMASLLPPLPSGSSAASACSASSEPASTANSPHQPPPPSAMAHATGSLQLQQLCLPPPAPSAAPGPCQPHCQQSVTAQAHVEQQQLLHSTPSRPPAGSPTASV